jgi:type II secretory pathway component PulM
MNAATHRLVPRGFSAVWDRASRRERRIAIVGATVVVLALAWAIVWQPLRFDIARTQEERARVGALLAQSRAAFDESVALSRATPKAVSPDPRSAVIRALGDRGIQVAGGSVDVRENRVHLVLPDVRFDTLIAALAALARDDGLRPVEATLTSRVEAGTVRAELTFAR